MAGGKSGTLSLLVGTRKGGFIMRSDRTRKKWKLSEPIFLGHIIHHFLADDRNGGTMLMAAKTGHLGPTVFRSDDRGESWVEAKKPPAFDKDNGERAVDIVFWLTRGHKAGEWYAGTAPAGLFHSKDDGKTWKSVDGFNNHPDWKTWAAIGATPGGQFLHSILINPNKPAEMYLGISVGGIFHSTDSGKNWSPLNKGCAADFLPDPDALIGHDPHLMVMHQTKPERLYHQNHCGIYRLDRPEKEWIRIGKNMPAEIGDIGFPIVLHPTDPDRAWVFPMDGTDVWPRTSPGGKPAVYTTKNAGTSWKRQSKGLPKGNAYFTVKRQAMTADDMNELGLYFGTSQGEVWASFDEGENWELLVQHLPEIYSLSISKG